MVYEYSTYGLHKLDRIFNFQSSPIMFRFTLSGVSTTVNGCDVSLMLSRKHEASSTPVV